MTKRVLVCGGRNFHDALLMNSTLERQDISILLHGGADGADRMAGRWAINAGVPVEVFQADWATHGRAAGPLRNQRMLDEGKPDLVIAFPGGKGTADMVRRAKAAGVAVLNVTTGE